MTNEYDADRDPLAAIFESLDAKVAGLPEPKLSRTRRPVSREARELLFRALRRGLDVAVACLAADIPKSTAYHLRSIDPKFARDFDLARAEGLRAKAEARFHAA